MPQLDKVTFLSQYFWLCIFYIGLYFVISKYFLPKMSRVLKLRKKKLHSSFEAKVPTNENEKTRASYATIVTQSLSTSRMVFHDVFVANTKFVQTFLSQINMTHCESLNIAYIASLGQNSLSQHTVVQHAPLTISSPVFFAVMLSKCATISSSSIHFAKKKDSSAVTEKKKDAVVHHEKKKDASDSIKSSKKK